jgi:hypothetical protein
MLPLQIHAVMEDGDKLLTSSRVQEMLFFNFNFIIILHQQRTKSKCTSSTNHVLVNSSPNHALSETSYFFGRQIKRFPDFITYFSKVRPKPHRSTVRLTSTDNSVSE